MTEQLVTEVDRVHAVAVKAASALYVLADWQELGCDPMGPSMYERRAELYRWNRFRRPYGDGTAARARRPRRTVRMLLADVLGRAGSWLRGIVA